MTQNIILKELPFPGRESGAFANKLKTPDFMRGSLSVYPYVDGEVKVVVDVSGDVGVDSALRGRIETNP